MIHTLIQQRRNLQVLSTNSDFLRPLPWFGTLWSLWLLIGLRSAWFAYGWAIATATTYGELSEAAFDLYRHLLYRTLHWNVPTEPAIESRVGQQFISCLWRG